MDNTFHAGRNFEPLPGGKTRVKTYAEGGALLSDEILPFDEAKALIGQPVQAPRFIARKLPEPLYQFDWGLENYYEVSWEMWDTVEQKRVGPLRGKLFADEKTCQGYANKWSYAAGPPVRCGSCGHVFTEGESTFGHEYYNILCYGCSASNED